LQTSINALNYDYVGHDRTNHTLSVYTTVERTLAELVTFSTVAPTAQDHTPHLLLWFHTREPVKLPSTIAAQREASHVGQPITFNASTTDRSGFSSFWELRLAGDAKRLKHKDLLALAFNTDDIQVGSAAQTLTKVIQETPLSFVGYDGDHTISTAYQVDNP